MQPIVAAPAAAGTGEVEKSIPVRRLVSAAHEFEAQMMKELLKPMTGKDALTGEDKEDAGEAGSNGALQEFASQALGQSLSQRGGFGIANSILHELSHSGNQPGTGKVTGIPRSNSVIKASQSLK